MTKSLTESAVLQACQTLFGPEVNVCRGFLFYLQPEGAKAAYRKRAKETHPDFFSCDAPHVQKTQASLFRDVVEAYEVVNLFFQQREDGLWRPPSRAHVTRQSPENRPAGKTVKQAYENKHAEAVRQKPLPSRLLQIGRYLYYRGFITYRTLIEAVAWQQKQRPIIGDIALRWGLLNTGAIEQITRARGVQGRFGEKAVDLGLLTSFQVRLILFYQHSQQERLGDYFVQKNILARKELEDLVRELREHNARVLNCASRSGQERGAYA